MIFDIFNVFSELSVDMGRPDTYNDFGMWQQCLSPSRAEMWGFNWELAGKLNYFTKS